jgi:acyl-CoA synthetase (AMP-forming)/AMP-acid ligase II
MLRGTTRIAPAPGQRWLLAYGLHQFAGLQILMHVLAAGATLVAPTPRRPREGLAAMRAHEVTHASATPTFWRFLVAELHADGGPVPDLRQITLGGEAIPAPLLPELRATFPNARISQVYAASEFGSSGSMRDGRNGLSTDVLNRGDDADIAMKIVDGELWVRSRTGMLGYYGEPAIDPDGWRPTGDLVEVVGDRIFFRGRNTEIISVGGVKVHPLPIEDRILPVPGVAMARVYGRPNPMTGAIVAVDVVAAPGADQDVVDEAIRAACADLPAAARPRRIMFVVAIDVAGN